MIRLDKMTFEVQDPPTGSSRRPTRRPTDGLTGVASEALLTLRDLP